MKPTRKIDPFLFATTTNHQQCCGSPRPASKKSLTKLGLMVTRVTISPPAIDAARERFLDEDKPDPIQERQIKGFVLSWRRFDAFEASDQLWMEQLGDKPTHLLEGSLIWKGEYAQLDLRTRCGWKGDHKDGKLFITSSIRCDLLTTEEASPKKQNIREKIMKRLKKDAYMVKVSGKDPVELFQATIKCHGNDLEERVHCNQDAAEAVKRAVFSSADTSLDVFDFVTALPILPCTFHTDIAHTSSLADRAKLRILEDVMYDACEDQGEEELVKDLTIVPPKKKKIKA